MNKKFPKHIYFKLSFFFIIVTFDQFNVTLRKYYILLKNGL